MKAAITDGKGKVWLEEIPRPNTGEYQCLCKTEACATCSGTDLKHINNKMTKPQDYPGVLGHESIGVVIELGSKVKNIKLGERFLRPTAVYNGEKLGGYYSLWGGFAEYGLITDVKALKENHPDAEINPYIQFQQKLPSDFNASPADSTMLITLKETASYVHSSGAGLYNSMLILGSGSVAYCMLRFAKIFGVHPLIVAARRDAPLEHAKNIGADFTLNVKNEELIPSVKSFTDGKGVDFIIDTSGNSDFFREATKTLAPNGKIAPYATYEQGTNKRNLAKEIAGESHLAPAVTQEVQAHQFLLDAVKLSLLDLKDYYSHKLPFSQISEGFQMLADKKAFKIVFEM